MSAPSPARIAIFDSGVGGLTVAGAIRRRLPAAELRYLGDTARLPYGTKSAATVTRYALQAAAALLGDMRETSALVVACNTASSCALPALADRFALPVIGVVEPGARAAVASCRSGHVGVIGTERTVASAAYASAIAALEPGIVIHSRATPLLVTLAEEGWFDHPVTEAALTAYLGPWFDDVEVSKMDTLVLGCTHYPVFKTALDRWLRRRLGRPVALVDSAEVVAKELALMLPAATATEPRGAIELLATDARERVQRVGGLFFPMAEAEIRIIDI